MLNGVCDRDVACSFRQGCWMECLTHMLDGVFDRDAEMSVHQGCWSQRLIGMLGEQSTGTLD